MSVAQADVCILPHKVDALTRTLDPIKLYDYLATGLPIVTTHVAMNPTLMPYVEIANGPNAFEKAVQKALVEPESEKDKRLTIYRGSMYGKCGLQRHWIIWAGYFGRV